MEHGWNLQRDDGKPKIYFSTEKQFTQDNRDVEPAVLQVVGFTRDTFDIVKLNSAGEVTIMGSKIELSAEQSDAIKKFVEAWISLQTES
jgi:hypothetical protein